MYSNTPSINTSFAAPGRHIVGDISNNLQAFGMPIQSKTNRTNSSSNILAANTTQRTYSTLSSMDTASSNLIAAGLTMKKVTKPVTHITHPLSQNQNMNQSINRTGNGGIIGVKLNGTNAYKSRFTPWRPTPQQYGMQVEKAHTVAAIFKAVTQSRAFLLDALAFRKQSNSQDPFNFSILKHKSSGELRIVMQIGQNTRTLKSGFDVNAIAKEVATSLEGPQATSVRGTEILTQYVQKTLEIYRNNQKAKL